MESWYLDSTAASKEGDQCYNSRYSDENVCCRRVDFYVEPIRDFTDLTDFLGLDLPNKKYKNDLQKKEKSPVQKDRGKMVYPQAPKCRHHRRLEPETSNINGNFKTSILVRLTKMRMFVMKRRYLTSFDMHPSMMLKEH